MTDSDQQAETVPEPFRAWGTIDRTRQTIGLALGPLTAVALLVFPIGGVPAEAARLAAVVAWVVIWWISEAVPLPATALLGPALTVALGVTTVKDAFSPFGDPVIFLFLGGFLMAQGMAVHGLDRRIALAILASRWVAGHPSRLLAAFALLAAGLSMWLSNTATTAMLYPIALGVLGASPPLARTGGGHGSFGSGLLLACAYGSSIGGIGTPVGTPPNIIAMGQLEKLARVHIGFLPWMALAVPVTLAMLAFALLYVRFTFPAPAGSTLDVTAVRSQQRALGPLTRGERNVALAFVVAVAGWVGPGLVTAALGAPHPFAARLAAALPESVVAVIAAALLFVLPVDWKARRFTLTWKQGADLDWGTLLLFGGGLSLGAAMFRTGLAAALGHGLTRLAGARSETALLALFTAIAVYLTEITSNTATATMLVPLATAAAQAAGVDPTLPAVGCALGCSMAFMLPVATPPNAIVYGSGRVPITHMARSGFWLNLAACVLIPAMLLLTRWVFSN
ncbi:MAG TPA: SLC13 family permease [Thermoanaerobaculaceae bacterium]|nr:SLC13 family permease [Thermoanaerobaculaceae bacterium]HRS16442.1 SLC13 family permease [Thermoanaerobaculaceae bacterium]